MEGEGGSQKLTIFCGRHKWMIPNCIRIGTFPEILKKAEVTPVFKKGDPTSKIDHRPVLYQSTLSFT